MMKLSAAVADDDDDDDDVDDDVSWLSQRSMSGDNNCDDHSASSDSPQTR